MQMESKKAVLYFKLWRQFLLVSFDSPLQNEPNLFASQPSNRMLDQNYLKATKVARNQHPRAV